MTGGGGSLLTWALGSSQINDIYLPTSNLFPISVTQTIPVIPILLHPSSAVSQRERKMPVKSSVTQVIVLFLMLCAKVMHILKIHKV